MKTWLLDDFIGLDALRLAEVPDPVPGDGEALIELEFAALNPADRYLSLGQYPAKPALPHVAGRDGIGVITALGKGVDQFFVDQRVLIIRGETGVNRWGTFAEKVVVGADSLAIPPQGWSTRQAGCAALVYLTAWQALTQWGELPPSTVLITGASGGVGVASIQLAKAMGHKVVALSRGTAKTEKLKEFGADFVVDSNSPQLGETVKQILGGHRVNLAIENICGPGFVQVIETMAPFGKISVVGQLGGPVANFNIASLFFRRIKIGGVALSTYTREGAHEAWKGVVKLMQKTDLHPVIDSIFTFDQLPAAFARLGQGPLGKVVLEIRKPASNGVPSGA
jgi:NADPH:quinone reductase